MRRGSRNTPLWILTGAAVVVLAATFNSRNGEERASRPAKHDRTALETPAPLQIEEPSLSVKPLEPLLPSKPAPAAPAETAEPIAASLSSEPVGSAGMVVGIDPETGTIGMPSRAFRDAMRDDPRGPALSRSADGLRVITRPDGSQMVDLQDRFQDYAIVRVAPDGRKEQSCVQGNELKSALAGSAEAAPRGEASHDAEAAVNDDASPPTEPTTNEAAER